jgi:hypothetical protein
MRATRSAVSSGEALSITTTRATPRAASRRNRLASMVLALA